MGLIKKVRNNRKHLIITCIVLVLIIAIAVFILINGRSAKASSNLTQQRTAAAFKGELNVTLSGSGTVSPVNRKEIVAVVNGVVTECYLEEGKSFKKGDVIVKFDDTDAQLNVKKLENALKQKELSMSNADISNDSLNIRAPINGRVSELNVKEGAYVNKGDKLMTIVDEDRLQTHLVFENASVSQFRSIHTLKIHIPDFMSSVTGEIVSVAQEGDDVSVTVSIDNPGALTSGLSVWAECAVSTGILTSEQGTMEFSNQEIIKADAAGKVANLSVSENSKVTQGMVLLSITDDALPYALESDMLSLEQAQVELKLAKEKLDNYTIRAPFDGVAVAVSNLDPGDTVESGTTIAILMDTSEMTFTVAIDELDISSVEIGQKVIVTVEALDNQQIEGKVTAIAPEGQSYNGVTSYDVTVTIPGSEKLKSGMNVDAVIQVINKQDVLLVPVEAIQKQGNGYIVWVKGAQSQRSGENQPVNQPGRTTGDPAQTGNRPGRMMGDQNQAENRPRDWTGSDVGTNQPGNQRQNRSNTSQNRNRNTRGTSDNYYSGASPVKVEVGMHNELYVEITAGLKEGDIVVLPPLVNNSNSSNAIQGGQNFMMPGGMGGMPGGMGGMPRGMGGMPGGSMRGGPSGSGSRRGN